ncbi:CHAT domain-containing protein [Nocardia sp. NPDC003183]
MGSTAENQLVVDIDADGRATARVSGGDVLAGGPMPPFAVRPVMTEADVEDLRWYFEDYLSAPFAVYEDRGAEIADHLSRWGTAMFDSLFGASPAMDVYRQFRASGNRGAILIRSTSPRWLSVPWELMWDPVDSAPLVRSGMTLARTPLLTAIEPPVELVVDRIRVLVVISRPSGRSDVGYRMIAREMIDCLQRTGGPIDVVVLRPPTLVALGEVLQTARASGRPFHVVHFDGHGVFTAEGSGALVFERRRGGEDHVSAERVAEVLGDAQVPLVVLNACQSGVVGQRLEAGVATRILNGGADAVLAMAYSVYAVAAAEFMSAFYDQLFSGRTFGVAVQAGRDRMANNPNRPSPKGPLLLRDWAVPVHYTRREVCFPSLASTSSTDSPTTDVDDQLSAADGFIGRDGYFYDLESAASTKSVIVLHGQAGTGKTELAKGFARWWQRTGALDHPDGVVWYSFDPGVSSRQLDSLVAAIGFAIDGTEFVALDHSARRASVRDRLRSQRLLVVLDNFETVATMPDRAGTTLALSEVERAELREFLDDLSDEARSVILVTSRNPELWLGANVGRIAVHGLSGAESQQYSDHLLHDKPQAVARRAHREYAELTAWLDGHPLAMRLTLPHLQEREPAELLSELRSLGPHSIRGNDGWLDTLTAGLRYSLAHLSAADRRLLLPLSLFHGSAEAAVLAELSRRDEAPPIFQGLDRAQWDNALNRATAVGLLSATTESTYRLHPALPLALAAQWRAELPESYHSDQEATQSALLAVFADRATDLHRQLTGGDAVAALRIVDRQARMFSSLLGYAIDQQFWAQAHELVRPLSAYWASRGLVQEAGAWVGRVRHLSIEGTESPTAAALSLWLYIVSAHANRLIEAGRHQEAEVLYTELRQTLDSRPTPEHAAHLITIDYQLGRSAQDRGDYDDAVVRFERTIIAAEANGDQHQLAVSSHQLGNIALMRRDLAGAHSRYSRALSLFDKLGDQASVVGTLYQLAAVSLEAGALDQAESQYNTALSFVAAQDDQPRLAAIYHQLALVADHRGQLALAEERCRQSLIIKERLHDEPGCMVTYQMLGVITYRNGDLAAAERWSSRSLELAELTGNARMAADCHHHLAIVALGRQDFDAAAELLQKSLQQEQAWGDRARLAETYSLLALCSDTAAALEWAIRGEVLLSELPLTPNSEMQLRAVHQRLAQLSAVHGRANVERVWRRVTGAGVPRRIGIDR